MWLAMSSLRLSLHRSPTVLVTLEPLYRSLHDHQIAVAPELAHLPARKPEDAWRRRLLRYQDWMARPGAFVLLASRKEEPVGYAIASLAIGYQGWHSKDRVGELHDLVVTPDQRGKGIGSAILNRAEKELSTIGAREIRLSVIAANADAIRFYRERGMSEVSVVMLGETESGLPPTRPARDAK
jgi:GNAT superfamily N-acetyltransferase